jgi:flagellin-like hook-associated protein FlgL
MYLLKKVNINDGPAAGAFRLNSPKNLLDTSEYMAEDGSFFEYETLYDHSESTPLATQLSTGEIAVVWQNYVEDETGHSYTTIDFQVLSTEPMQISTANGARGAIEKIDNALGYVANIRSKLGAISNRLTHTVSNLTNISANLSAARGGIEDADFAFETTQLAKNQILQQASTAMLAQANASKQNVLSLLQG